MSSAIMAFSGCVDSQIDMYCMKPLRGFWKRLQADL